MTIPPVVRQLALRNYKSIASCSLRLGPLAIFVGRNGAGKSNILDALRFTADALNSTLEYALRERGGVDQVRRRSLRSRPTHFRIELRVELPQGHADYAFEIGAVAEHGFVVQEESCIVVQPFVPPVEYRVRAGRVEAWTLPSAPPAASQDRLFLVAVSGETAFQRVFDALSRMVFHNLSPDAMKVPHRPEPGTRLAHDGRNIASVVKSLRDSESPTLARAVEYLRAIGVDVSEISHRQLGAFETVEFVQNVPNAHRPWRFDAASMSDGTLRALGILVSVLSASNGVAKGPTLVGIEEPETALHPAAAATLLDALLEGAQRTQIIVTCHSPDLLEHAELDPDCLFVVDNEDGRSRVAPLSTTTKAILQKHLSTAAELQRLDQLAPDRDELARQDALQGRLFEDDG